MPELPNLLAFALLSLGMVLTPGPNMIYVISRSIAQGPAAGLVSLGGVGLGFVVYMLSAAFGITALLLAVPYAYDALRLAGVAYLLYLAWQTIRPGGRSPFEIRELPVDGRRKLFVMGFLTNLLNPKIAILYLSLLPQFIRPDSRKRINAIRRPGRCADRYQPCCERCNRAHRGVDCRHARRAPCLACRPTLDHGPGARRVGGPHGDGGSSLNDRSSSEARTQTS